MNLRPLSCAKVSALLRPTGREQTGASGLNGGNTTGLVMPGGPSCAVPGPIIPIARMAKTARQHQPAAQRMFMPSWCIIRSLPATETQGAHRCQDVERYIPPRHRWCAPSH